MNMRNKNILLTSPVAVMSAATLALSAASTLSAAERNGGAGASDAQRAYKRPNVLLIMTDQQWAGAMSCAGNADLETPNMDRLAARGVRFGNAYCAMPLSGPSRAAMFTGYMPSRTGMDVNEKPLVDSLRSNTLGQIVEQAGYDCAYSGKWHVNTISIPNGEFGFRNIHDSGDPGVAEACVDYLKKRAKSPFFLVASFVNPHNICEFARGQKTPYVPTPVADVADCPNLPSNFERSPYDAKILQYEQSRDYSLYPSVDYSPDDWRRYRNAYYRLVEAVDTEIGKILDELDRQGLWDETVVIFTSDHGDGAGAHKWNQKTALYEEVANVPLIVCLPRGKNAGEVSNALVNNGLDLMPSVCEWTGAVLPDGRRGKSFAKAAALEDDGQEFIITETNFKQTSGTAGWMVRTPKYKYVLYDKGLYREQLFDMETDRGETINLAVESAYAPVLEQMRSKLRNWLESTPGPERRRNLKAIPE